MKTIQHALLSTLLASSAVFAQVSSSDASSGSASVTASGWIDRGFDDGVALFERAERVNGFKGFRGVLRVNAPMKTVLALVLVRETFPKWVANMLEDSTLPDNNPDASLCYMWIKGVWPTDDRDVVCKVSVSQDPQSLAVSVVAQDTDPKLMPTVKGRVRMAKLYSGFTVRPISANLTEVQLDAIADPAGNVPTLAANMVAKGMPRDTLRALAKLAETPSAVDLSALDSNKFASLAMKKIKLPS